MAKIKHQIIEDEAGKRVAAVVPWEDYVASGLYDPALDTAVPDAALSDEDLARRSHLMDEAEERIPGDVVQAALLGSPIKAYRKWRGLSQQDLAAAIGTKPAYLSQIETGRRKGSTDLLKQIATALRVDLDMIVE
ncbi:MAG: helix-turn-helix transcriptional regulator [Alphaproteobacteria bacterium]